MGAGTDTLLVAKSVSCNVTAYGGSGADDLRCLGKGVNTVYGGDGNDFILGSTGADVLYGGSGDDTIDGGAGNDTIHGNGNASDAVATGETDNDTISGSAGDDAIWGEGGDDRIAGNDGNDYIDGGTGNDSLSGDAGADWLLGGAGNDTLAGLAGADVLQGGAGNDSLTGGADADVVSGGDGDDTLNWGMADGTDSYVDGGAGTDSLIMAADNAANTITFANVGTMADVTATELTTQNPAKVFSHAGSGVQVDITSGSNTLSLSSTTVERISLDARAGEDFITVGSLAGTAVNDITFNAGVSDGSATYETRTVYEPELDSQGRQYLYAKIAPTDTTDTKLRIDASNVVTNLAGQHMLVSGDGKTLVAAGSTGAPTDDAAHQVHVDGGNLVKGDGTVFDGFTWSTVPVMVDYTDPLTGSTRLPIGSISGTGAGAAIEQESALRLTGTVAAGQVYSVTLTNQAAQACAITGIVADNNGAAAGGAGEISVAGDQSARFSAGSLLSVMGSAADDGSLRITGVSYNSATDTTVITVDGTLRSSLVQGTVVQPYTVFKTTAASSDANAVVTALATQIEAAAGYKVVDTGLYKAVALETGGKGFFASATVANSDGTRPADVTFRAAGDPFEQSYTSANVALATPAGGVKAGQSFYVAVDGVDFKYVAQSGDDMAKVAAGLRDAINNATGANGFAAASLSGTTLTITRDVANAQGTMAFQVDSSYSYQVAATVQVEKPFDSSNDNQRDTIVVQGSDTAGDTFTLASLPSLTGNEVQRLAVTGTGGSYTLSYTDNGTTYTTAAIAADATSAQIQSALNTALANAGITVTVDRVLSGTFDVTFSDAVNRAPLVVTSSLTGTGAGATVAETTPGGTPPAAEHTVKGVLQSGSYKLNLTLNNVFRDSTDPQADGSFAGDNITFDGQGGADRIDASGMQSDFIAVQLKGGAGNDVLVGTKFDDILDGGLGDDQYTGGYGVDQFFDAGGTDTLVETFDRDMTLMNRYFVSGNMIGDDGGTFTYQDTSTEGAPRDPEFPMPTILGLAETGDRYAAGADVEELKGIFEAARLTGGTSANVMVVGDIDGIVRVGATALAMDPAVTGQSNDWNWSGAVTLNNVSNIDNGALSEYYILNLTGNDHGNITIADTGGTAGFDELVVFGTEGDDTFSLLQTSKATNITAGYLVAGDLYDPAVPYSVEVVGEQLSLHRNPGEDATTAPYNATLTAGSGSVAVVGQGSEQVDLVKLDVANKAFSVTLPSGTYSYTAKAGETLDDVAAALLAKVDPDGDGKTGDGYDVRVARNTLVFTGAGANPTVSASGTSDLTTNSTTHEVKVSLDVQGLTWTLAVNGKSYSYTGVDGDTLTDVTLALQAQIRGINPDRDEVHYANMERVTLRSLGGDDSFLSDDNAVQTVIDMGRGDDSITIGTVPQFLDKGNKNLEYPDGVPVADTDNMTKGNSAEMLVFGGDQDDYFEVNHNSAQLWLDGGNHDDTFVVNTFIVLRDNPNAPSEVSNLTTLFGGSGNNRYEYLQNAPVAINGGDGIDTIVINGTPIADTFVITKDFVAGAGRIVNFVNIERLEVNGSGGADQIYVLSTNADMELTVRGGTGDDQIHLGGDHPPMVFDPPEFTYQPPSYLVQDGPIEVPTAGSYDPDRQWISTNWWDWSWGSTWDALWDRAYAQTFQWYNSMREQNAYFRITGIDFNRDGVINAGTNEDNPAYMTAWNLYQETASSMDWDWENVGWWVFWSWRISYTYDVPLVTYTTSELDYPDPRLVVPDPVTVDPPPFAFKLDAVYTVADIQGKVTLDGGTSFGNDQLFVHNENGVQAIGANTAVLTDSSVMRMDGLRVQATSDGDAAQYADVDTTRVAPNEQTLEFTHAGTVGAGTYNLSLADKTWSVQATASDTAATLAAKFASAVNASSAYGTGTLHATVSGDLLTLEHSDVALQLSAIVTTGTPLYDAGALERVADNQLTVTLESPVTVGSKWYIELPGQSWSVTAATGSTADVATALAAAINGDSYGGGTLTATAVGGVLTITHSNTAYKLVVDARTTDSDSSRERARDTFYIPMEDASGNAIYDTFLNLQGLGMGEGTALDGTHYDGVRIENFDNLSVRLSGAADNVVIDSTLAAGTTTFVLGGGDDHVLVEQLKSDTVVLGGAGNDVVTVGAVDGATGLGSLANIGDLLTFKGDDHVAMQSAYVPYDSSNPNHVAVLSSPLVNLVTIGGVQYLEVAVVTLDQYGYLVQQDVQATNAGDDTRYNDVDVNRLTPTSYTAQFTAAGPLGAGLTLNISLPDATYSYTTNASDTAASVATALAAQINGKAYDGGVLTATADAAGKLSVSVSVLSRLDLMVTQGQPLYLDVFGNEVTNATNPAAMSGGVQLKGLQEVDGNGKRLFVTSTGSVITEDQLADHPDSVPKYYQDADTNRADSGAAPLYTFTIGGQTFYTNQASNEPLMVKANVTRDIIFSKSSDVASSAAGYDSLIVNDTANTEPTTGQLDASQVTGLGLAQGIRFDHVDNIIVNLGAGSDTFTLDNTITGTVNVNTNGGDDTVNVADIDGSVTVTTGAGADTINVGNAAHELEDIDGALVLNGGSAVAGEIDIINVDDGGDSDDESLTLTSTTISGLGMGGSISYASAEILNLALGSGDNTVRVASTHSQATNIDTGAGDDDVTIETVSGNTTLTTGEGADDIIVGKDDPATTLAVDRSLAGIDATLSLITGNGADTLLVDTRASTGDLTGSMTATRLSGLGMGGRIDYSGIDEMTVELGAGDDAFDATAIGAAHLIVHGNAGNDSLYAMSSIGGTAPATGLQVDLDGNGGDDTVTAQMLGSNAVRYRLTNTTSDGSNDGVDEAIVLGTAAIDNVLVEGPREGDSPFVGYVTVGQGLADELRYENFDHLTVRTLGGADRILVMDTNIATLINMGDGSDTITIGQVVTTQIDGVDVVDPTRTTDGNSAELTVVGGDGNDKFTVDHNEAVLWLYGDGGDDTFVINTFLVLRDRTTGEISNLANITGGEGSDQYEYLANAPVHIDGGDGYDTVTINGTPIGDQFVVTDQFTIGAGRWVGYTNIERLEINAAGGDDEIYILSTSPDLETIVRGGDGNDIIHLGGEMPPMLFNLDEQFVPQQSQLVSYDTTVPGGTMTYPDPVTVPVVVDFWSWYFGWWYYTSMPQGSQLLNYNILGWSWSAIYLSLTYVPPPTFTSETHPTVSEDVTPPAYPYQADPFFLQLPKVDTLDGIQGKLTIDGGNTIGEDNILYVHDEGGAPYQGAYLMDMSRPERVPVMVPVLDVNGDPVFEQQIVYDANGEPVLDANGQFMTESRQVLQQKTEAVLDGNGQPIIDLVQRFQEDHRTPVLDSNGNPIYDAVARVRFIYEDDRLESAGVQEVQHLDLAGATGDSFTLSVGGTDTAAIAWNADSTTLAGTIKSALEGVLPAGVTVDVTAATGGGFDIAWSSYAPQALLQVTNASAGVSASVAELTAGARPNATQTFTAARDGDLTFTYHDQTVTLPVTINQQTGLPSVTAAALETALEGLSSIADVSVTGSGTAADPWVVTFLDADLDGGQYFALGTGGVANWAGQASYRNFLGLMGMGMASGTDLTGGWYDGVELYNLTSIDMRLSRANGDFVVLDNSFAGTTQVVTGGGDDYVYIARLGGETTVLGGAGDDMVYAGYDGGTLDVAANLTFDGDGDLTEQLIEIPLTDPLFQELQAYGPTGADLADDVAGKFWVRTANLDGNNEIMYGDQFVYDANGNQLFWNVLLNKATTESTLTLSYGGQTTGTVDWLASSAEIQAALNALGSVQAAGGVTVAGGQAFATTDVNGTPFRNEVQQVHWSGWSWDMNLGFTDSSSGQYAETGPLPFWASSQQVEDALNNMASIQAAGGVSVDGIDVTVTTEAQGQVYDLNFSNVTGGSFTLDVAGQTTAAINWSNDAEALAVSMRSALQAVAPTGSTVSVAHLGNGLFEMRFTSDARVTVDETVAGNSTTAEQQTLTFDKVSGGRFTLSWNGAVTGPIDWNADETVLAANVQMALGTLGIPGGATVTGGSAGDITVAFATAGMRAPIGVDAGQLLGTDMAVAVNDGALAGTGAATQLVDAGDREVQRLHLDAGGSTLTLVYGGGWTWNMPWDVDAAEVERELDWVVPGGVSVVEDAASHDLLVYFNLPGYDATQLIGFNQDFTGRSWQVTFDAKGQQNQIAAVWGADTSTLTEGEAHETQRLFAQADGVTAPQSGDKLYFTFEGEAVELTVGSDAATVEAALNALGAIQGHSGVKVSTSGSGLAGTEANPWIVTFDQVTDDVEQISGARQITFGSVPGASLTVDPETFGAQEKQELVLANVAGGSFTLTLGTVTTGAIAWDANDATLAANIEAALDGTPGIGDVTVTVATGSAGTQVFDILWNVMNSHPQLTVGTASLAATPATGAVTTTTNGGINTFEVKSLSLAHVGGGTFTLTSGSGNNADTTAPISWSANDQTLASNIQSALNTALGGNKVLVTAAGNQTFTIEYTSKGNKPGVTIDTTGLVAAAATGAVTTLEEGNDGNALVAAIHGTGSTVYLEMRGDVTIPLVVPVVDTSLEQAYYAGGQVSIATMVAGDSTTQELQRMMRFGVPAGTFTLEYQGQETAPIAWNASTAEIEAALDALVPGGVTVFATPVVAQVTAEGTASTAETVALTRWSDDSGVFRLGFGGASTADLAWNASAADIAAALNGLATVQAAGGVTVTASGSNVPGTELNPWVVTFNQAGNQGAITATSTEQEGVSRNPWFVRFDSTGDQDIIKVHDAGLRNFVYQQYAGNDSLIMGNWWDQAGMDVRTWVEYQVAQPRDLAVKQDYTHVTGLTGTGSTLSYTGVDHVSIYTGDGNDTFDIGGTTAQLYVAAAGGDDDFFVGNGAGSLDDVLHDILLDGGWGVSSLEVTDSGDADADLAAGVTDNSLQGFATGTINYFGDQYDTVDLHGAQGGNTINVWSDRAEATTTLDAGIGDDNVGVYNGATGVLVIHGQAGNDILDASQAGARVTLTGDAGNDVLYGSAFDDELHGNAGNDVIVGNLGSDSITGDAGDDILLGDGGTLRDVLGAIFTGRSVLPLDTIVATPGAGGNDTIDDSAGNDMIIAGRGLDIVTDAGGDDVVFGDEAVFDLVAGPLGDQRQYTGTGDGEADSLTLGDGNAIVAGGGGSDAIALGSGDSLVAGDNLALVTLMTGAYVSARSNDSIGAADSIDVQGGNVVLLGGAGGDTLTAGLGRHDVMADNGDLTWTAATLTAMASTDAVVGGDDVLTLGTGDHHVVLGIGSDQLFAAAGNSVLLGDNGSIGWLGDGTLASVTGDITGGDGSDTAVLADGDLVAALGNGTDQVDMGNGDAVLVGDGGSVGFHANGVLASVSATAGAGGDDTLNMGDGNVVAALGEGNDRLVAGNGQATVLGDSGSLSVRASGVVDTVLADSVTGGNDTVSVQDGDVLVLGGVGQDTVDAGLGRHVVLGDNGEVRLDTDGALLSATTIDTLGDADGITLGNGDNVVIAGQGGDTVQTGTGTDIVLGDNGRVLYAGATGLLVRDVIGSLDDAWGGDDVITLGTGSKLAIGGTGADTVDALAGDHDVIGDNGSFIYTNGNLTQVDAGNSVDGAGDTVTLGAGDQRLILGIGGDTLVAGSGRTLLLGDNGTVTLQQDGTPVSLVAATTANDGNDDITLGDGNVDAILGDGADLLAMGNGNAVLVADGGSVSYYLSGIVDAVFADSMSGGNDRITVLDGDVIVGGGAGRDTIDAGLGRHIVLGDNGIVDLDTDGALFSATTIDTLGDADTVTLGDGDNAVILGQGGDQLATGAGADIVIGDNGQLRYTGATGSLVRDRITALDDAFGGDDVITLGTGSKLVIGGTGADTVDALAGDHDVIGDNGSFTYTNGNLTQISAGNSTDGAGDTVTLGAGDQRLILGIGGDTLVAGSGRTLLLGDNGTVTLQQDGTPVSLVAATTANDGADDLALGNGNVDAVLGDGADLFSMGNGNAVLVADGGSISYYLSGIVDTLTADSLTGGDDQVTVLDGDLTLAGGAGRDTVDAGLGQHRVLGDNGVIHVDADGALLDAATIDTLGDADTVTLGNGDNVVILGQGSDSLSTGTGTDIVIGDNGQVVYTGATGSLVRSLIGSLDEAMGGDDVITLGDGSKLVIGGVGADTVDALAGDHDVIGDNGNFGYTNGNLTQIDAGNSVDGAGDTVTLGVGDQRLILGIGGDTLVAGSGRTLLLGDNGTVTLQQDGTPVSLVAATTANDGADDVTLGDGNVDAILGDGADTFGMGNGDAVLVGDGGSIDYYLSGIVDSVTATAGTGGNDTVTIGDGNVTALLGEGADTLAMGNGNAVLLGDSGNAVFYGSGILDTATADSTSGGDDLLGLLDGNALVLGGVGQDTIAAGLGQHVVLGDNGQVHADADGALLSATTIDTLGAADGITLGDGDNVVIAGQGGDTVQTGTGTDIVIGDNGQVLFTGATGSLVRDQISSLDDAFGGDDVITLGTGSKLVIGGTGADTVDALAGDHDVIGDNGSFTYTNGNLTQISAGNSTDGAGDTVTLGAGDQRLILGIGGDTLVAGSGRTLLLGDNGTVTLQQDGTPVSLVAATTANDGNDDITLGDGNVDAILGGGADTFGMGNGDAVLVGDGGSISYYLSGIVETVAATAGTGGDDTLAIGDGNVVALLGEGADVLTMGNGDAVLLGDSGAVNNYASGILDSVLADSATGGDDQFTVVDGDVVVAGGAGRDAVDAGLGQHLVLGDNGSLDLDTDGALLGATTLDTLGDADTVTLGDGDNVVILGQGGDTLQTGTGADIVVGDNGRVLFMGTTGALVRDRIETLDDAFGGDDVISLGDGSKLVIGGVGADTVDALAGDHDVVGDNGSFIYTNGNLTQVDASNSVDGAGDTITLGAGDQRLVLGIGSDSVTAGNGDTILLGDNGTITLQQDGTLVSMVAGTTAGDGDDTMTLGSGDLDAILGGGADTLAAADGNTNLIGDGGDLQYYGSGLLDTATADSSAGGSDSVTLGNGTGNSVLLGGVGADALVAADGDHVIGGDNAFVHLDTDGALLRGVSLDVLGDGDTLTTGTGVNILLGGAGADAITTGNGTDIVVGDNGEVVFVGSTGSLVRDHITTRDLASGGNDTIVMGTGSKTVLAGDGADSVTAGDGDHDVFGDNGAITYGNGIAMALATSDSTATDANSGGSDVIALGTGSNRVLAGLGNDQVTTGDGSDVILGDLGSITLDSLGRLVGVNSLPTLQGGDDVIVSGNGRGWLIGGVGNDTITAGSGPDGVIGDNGLLTFAAGVLQKAESTDTDVATTGDDVIDTDGGDDFVIAGLGSDTVDTAAGNDIVLADGGFIDWVGRDGNAATVDQVQSGDPWLGGQDTVTAGDGNDAVIGGAGSDHLEGGSGNDYVIGDGGLILYVAGALEQMQTLDPYTGGAADWIDGGAGQDILFGGEGDDTFVANFLEDAVIGDYARFTAESKTMIRFGNDLIGTSQLGVYASDDPFRKEVSSLGGRGYHPVIVSESLLARLARENGEGGRHRVSGLTEEVELAGLRDAEIDPSTLADPFVELAPSAGEGAELPALPGTRADAALPAPDFPGDEAGAQAEAGEMSDAASAAALALGWGVVRRGARKRKAAFTAWDSYSDGLGR